MNQDIPLYSACARDVRLMANNYLAFVQQLYSRFPNSDIVRVRIGSHCEYYVFDPRFMKEILVERPAEFPRHEQSIEPLKALMGGSLMNMEGGVWKSRRSMLASVFGPKAAASDGERASQGAADRIAAMVKECRDAEESMTRLSMRTMFQVVFSVQSDEYLDAACEALRKVCLDGTEDKRLGRASDKQLMTSKILAKRELERIIDSLVAARRNQGAKNDVLGRLLSASDNEGRTLGQREIRDECLAIFIAGHVTTAAALTWWSIHMAQNREAQQRAAHEVRDWKSAHPGDALTASALPYVAASLKESMRLRPASGVLLSRVAASDTTLGSYEVPGGTVLRITPAVLHRDPRWFAEPDLFRPERFLDNGDKIPRGAYMPYGNGPRICIGLHLANIELLYMASQLLGSVEWTTEDSEASVGTRLCFAMLPEKSVGLEFEDTTGIACPP